jgi:predicted Mrr-cat superfamily restriction endonuclease
MEARKTWVIRAGQGNEIIDVVEAKSVVAIGWREMGDCSSLLTRDDFRQRYHQAYPDEQYVGG